MKAKLQSFITNRVHNVTYDCRSFLWVRLEHGEMIDDKMRIGGGNLLMATGLFAALEYLGNIYALLSRGADAPRGPKECGNHLSARSTFANLIINCPIKLGLEELSEIELKKVWDAWRNGLVHLLVQRSIGTAVTIFDPKQGLKSRYLEISRSLESQEDVFTKENGWWSCNVDKMTAQLDRIADWVAGRCDDKDAHVDEALCWVEEN